MKVQIEVTTKCNLGCEYCFRSGENELSLEIIENLQGFDEYVVYGYGEPFMHKNLKKILENLDGRIILSTNGMFDVSNIADFVDVVAVSLDVDNSLRKGFIYDLAIKNLKKLEGKGIAQIVLTKENIFRLKDFLSDVARFGDVMLTNVVAKDEKIYEKALYFEISRKVYEICKNLEEDFLLKVLSDAEYRRKFSMMLEDIYGCGYSLNLHRIVDEKRRGAVAEKAEKFVEELEEVVEMYGSELIKPEFFGDSVARECPYRSSIFIRADGSVAPCMSFAYEHEEFVNSHPKTVKSYLAGNLYHEDFDEIYSRFRDFENLRSSMDSFPWCSDCPYVVGCWYAARNIDCYNNFPSCSECLYSARIARCFL